MSDNLGLGVMLSMLSDGDKTSEALRWAVGKKIGSIKLEGNKLRFDIEGCRLAIWDAGQSCCEERYMTTDDLLGTFTGATFMGAETRDVSDRDDCGFQVHEVQFLLITTSLGVFTVETHNVHNGYYAGFSIIARLDGKGRFHG